MGSSVGGSVCGSFQDLGSSGCVRRKYVWASRSSTHSRFSSWQVKSGLALSIALVVVSKSKQDKSRPSARVQQRRRKAQGKKRMGATGVDLAGRSRLLANDGD
ncbi:hypothetical protein Q7P37_007096 [Cladosporium fusiforme]